MGLQENLLRGIYAYGSASDSIVIHIANIFITFVLLFSFRFHESLVIQITFVLLSSILLFDFLVSDDFSLLF